MQNTDIDMINDCVDELYDLMKDKKTGFGIIRIGSSNLISEYHIIIDDIRKFDVSKNLCIVQAKDSIDRKTMRRVCLMRYSVIRNETKPN